MSLYHPTGVTLKPRSWHPQPQGLPDTHEPPLTNGGSPLCTLVPESSPKVSVVVKEDVKPAVLQHPERTYLLCLFCSSWVH